MLYFYTGVRTSLAIGLLLSGMAAAQTPLVVASATRTPAVETHAASLRTGRPDDVAIAQFYASRGDAPFWTTGPRRAALAAAMRAAPDQALPAANAATLALLEGSATDVQTEIALMRAYLGHARMVSSGLLTPRRIDGDIMVDPPVRSAAALLADLAATSDTAGHLAGLAPAHPDYERLQTAYLDTRRQIAGAAQTRLSGGPTLRPGQRSARVLELRARLATLGIAPVGQAADPARFDDALEAAVRRFQADQQLNTDGIVGPATRSALNVGPEERLVKIAVNMERLRWKNQPLGHRHIIVNQPDFTVRLVEGDRVLFDERVVIGRRDRQTPEFSDQMEHLVFNPTWFVPRSIATKDILPKLHEDPTYLQRSNMVLTRSDGGPMPFDPSSHDFTVYTRSDFPYSIRQRPSGGNALGQVKFMFPNNHAIYLHDTPSRNLFNRDSRAYSSGCVRVRDPMRLAALLLAPQVDDPEGYIQRLIASGRERYVHLDTTVPVHLTYRTAVIDDFGTLRFRRDIYGRDAKVVDALRAAGVALPAL